MKINPLNIEKYEDHPVFASTTDDLKVTRRPKRRLRSLYDSDKWEMPWWNRSTERSWKNHRKTQYKIK